MNSDAEQKMMGQVQQLSSQSSSFANLDPSETLEIIEEMIQIVKKNNWSSTGKWVDKELALLKLIPSEAVASTPQNVKYSSHAKTVQGLTEFGLGFTVLEYLETLRTRFKTELYTLETHQ